MTDYTEYGRQFAAIYDGLFPAAHVTNDQVRWLAGLVPDEHSVRIVELGVGTGRIALPLTRALGHRALHFVGLDVSQEMLDALAVADRAGAISRVLGDATVAVPATDADLALCVCATISMIVDPDQQVAVFRNAAGTLRRGGLLVVETHNPHAVRSMHVDGQATLAIPYGPRQVLVSFSDLDFPTWSVQHCWVDGNQATFANEVSRLTSLVELDGYASAAGLEPIGHYSGLDGAPLTPHAPTVTGVYRRP